MKKEHKHWAVILGGSSGLGLASAEKLANEGYNICIIYRERKANLKEIEHQLNKWKQSGIEALGFNKDALKSETIQDVIQVLPKKCVKVLVHSIAKGSLKSLSEMTLPDLEITQHAMALSWWEWSQQLIKNELFTDDARNIAFTSEGNAKAITGYGAVSIAKASLEALMRQMAVEYASLGIKTNCLQAGVTITKSFKMIPGNEQIAAFAQKRNPFQKLTTPEEIANVVYLLTTPEAKWINGTILKVDGGESLR